MSTFITLDLKSRKEKVTLNVDSISKIEASTLGTLITLSGVEKRVTVQQTPEQILSALQSGGVKLIDFDPSSYESMFKVG